MDGRSRASVDWAITHGGDAIDVEKEDDSGAAVGVVQERSDPPMENSR